MFLFSAWAFTTLFWAVNKYDGFYNCTHIAACAIICFTANTLVSHPKWIIKMFISMIIAAMLSATIGLAQQFFDWRWVPMAVSPAATFGNPNMAADYMAIIIPIIISMGVFQKNSSSGYYFILLQH